MFANLSRRSQPLVQRQLRLIEASAVADADRRAGMRLAQQAHQVAYARAWERWDRLLRRLGRRGGWLNIPQLPGPWQDTISQRSGWRERAANLNGAPVFAVDYLICRRCAAGWVEEPHTEPRYQRCGLAAAGLTRLRAEAPRLELAHRQRPHERGEGVLGRDRRRRPQRLCTAGAMPTREELTDRGAGAPRSVARVRNRLPKASTPSDTVTAMPRETVAGSGCWNGARTSPDQTEPGETCSGI